MPETKEVAKMLAVPFSYIPPEEMDPLWAEWVYRRHVTILVAPGGTSKGLFTIDMAARVTMGKPFPGEPEGTAREPENVVIIAPEDDPNEAVAWRLRAAGADLSKVFNLTVLPDGSQFQLPQSVGLLRDAIEQIVDATGVTVGLVIIDPLMALSTVNLNTNKGARSVIDPLEKLAHDQRCAIVLTHHTVKSGKTAGSKGLTDAVRAVLRIEKAKEGGNARILSVEKANNMSDEATLRYLLVGDSVEDTCLVWPSEVEQVAAEFGSRGYKINPDLTAQAGGRHAAPQQVELYSSDGTEGATKVGKFESAPLARKFAEDTVKHSLTWTAGPIAGSSGAAAYLDGKFLHFSVLPVEAKS